MSGKSAGLLAGGMAAVCLVTAAEAAIVTQALYRCGELGDDPNVSLLATTGTNATVWVNGTESIQDVDTSLTRRPDGSTKYVQSTGTAWSPGVAYNSNVAYNWGMSTWVLMPTSIAGLSNGQYYVMSNNADFSGNAINVRQNAGVSTWHIGHGFIAPVDSSLWGQWVHTALVYNGNQNAEFYVNGTKLGALAVNAKTRNDQYGWLYIGSNEGNNTASRFAKALDDVHVFSFSPGQFQISDVYSAVPEPHGLAISAAVCCVGLAFRRRASRLGR